MRQILAKRQEQEEKPLFIVNRKPRTNVINQRSCFSRETVKLSNGDQTRYLKSKMNESMHQSMQLCDEFKQSPRIRIQYTATNSQSKDITGFSDPIKMNNSLKINVSP